MSLSVQYQAKVSDILELLKEKYSLPKNTYILSTNVDCYCEDDFYLCSCIPDAITLAAWEYEDKVVCAKCGAKEGERCKTSSGKNTRNHKGRKFLSVKNSLIKL